MFKRYLEVVEVIEEVRAKNAVIPVEILQKSEKLFFFKDYFIKIYLNIFLIFTR